MIKWAGNPGGSTSIKIDVLNKWVQFFSGKFHFHI